MVGHALFDPFAAVERIFAGDAFSPAVDAFAVRGEQQNAAAIGASKARLKKMDERHVNFAEGDGFNLHRSVSSTEYRYREKNPLSSLVLALVLFFDAYDQSSSQCPSRNLPLPAHRVRSPAQPGRHQKPARNCSRLRSCTCCAYRAFPAAAFHS